jgi:hypothetical protein
MIVYTADLGALAVMIGTFAGYLPVIAGFLAVIWYCIQIWESKTVKRLTGRRCQ